MASVAAIAIVILAAKIAAPVAGGIAARVVATAFGRVLATAAATAAATAIAPAAKVATSAGIAALSAALTIPPFVEPEPFVDHFTPVTPEAMSAYRKAVADWEHARDEWNANVPPFSGFEDLFSEPRPRQPVGTERYACDL